jgi:hypothetical protein
MAARQQPNTRPRLTVVSGDHNNVFVLRFQRAQPTTKLDDVVKISDIREVAGVQKNVSFRQRFGHLRNCALSTNSIASAPFHAYCAYRKCKRIANAQQA